MEFVAETFQNEYLPVGGVDVDAVVTVTASGSGSPAAVSPVTAVVVIIIDVSGSMRWHRRIDHAKQAARVAIDRLREGVLFGIVAGSQEGRFAFPHSPGLVAANGESRKLAKAAVDNLVADGGTAMGRWLMEARQRFIPYQGAIRQAILLTDGFDESETRDYLEAVVRQCEGVFQCDCRGVGTDWRVDELRLIASRLLGSVDIVAEPEDMPADFEAIITRAMAKRAADVSLRLWTPRGGSITFVKQVSPTLEDLTTHGVRVDDRTTDFPTGAWGDESRDYHVHLVVNPQEAGAEMLAGRISLVVDGTAVSQSLVRAIWTDDVAASTRIHPQVAHYNGQAELAAAIAEGLEARAAGDEATATAKLGRAAHLAAETANEGTLRLLARVVDIVDAGTGTVRLRRQVATADELALETRSTRTVRTTAEA
jgi:hypothetical protein